MTTLFFAFQAKALTVVVKDYGEISTAGIEIEVTEAKIDEFTDEVVMGINGSFVTDAEQLIVTIQRPEAGLQDEFCCGTACTAGNEEKSEVKTFTTSGAGEWYAHYFPKKDTPMVFVYTFSDGTESRTLTVLFRPMQAGIEDISADKQGNGTFTLSGARVQTAQPGGVYIQNGQKRIITH